MPFAFLGFWFFVVIYFDIFFIKKKERRQFDTSTKRGIRKQAREDIRILKYESRQLKKEQTAARKSAKRQAKLEKQQIKQQLSEERKKERTANKASNQPPASGKSKKKKRKEITLEDYLPIDKIANGVIYTTDHRYVKILEIEPINFLLRSAREQQGIIFSFISYLKNVWKPLLWNLTAGQIGYSLFVTAGS